MMVCTSNFLKASTNFTWFILEYLDPFMLWSVLVRRMKKIWLLHIAAACLSKVDDGYISKPLGSCSAFFSCFEEVLHILLVFFKCIFLYILEVDDCSIIRKFLNYHPQDTGCKLDVHRTSWKSSKCFMFAHFLYCAKGVYYPLYICSILIWKLKEVLYSKLRTQSNAHCNYIPPP